MATETTPSETTMNESIEEKMEELRIEKMEDAQKEVDTSIPEDQQTHEVALAEIEAPEDQDSLKVLETPEVAEKESSNEQEAYQDKVPADENASDLMAEEKPTKEASESAEADREKEANVEGVREVSIPTVDHRSGAGDESKTEDVPTTVVHETRDGVDPSPPLSEACKDKVPADENASDLVAEEKSKKEASESAEADREKEVNVAEVRDVSIPTVDHRSGAGDESKTEDVPTTVVHETRDGVNPSPRRSGDIFQNVGSKMMQSVQKLKNVISGKSSNGKSSKSTD